MEKHIKYMQRCLQLAELGKSLVSLNPMVGAVIVHNDIVIGEGFHERFGEPHAEVNAINMVLKNFKNANELLLNSTLYVSLEPCSHTGKTPPCTDLIIKHKIPEVQIACLDPFSKVNGKGMAQLKESGIKVEIGILEQEVKELNKRFFTYHNLQRPYVIIKFAESVDGFMGSVSGEPFQFSNNITSRLTHKWRSEEKAILVGANTVAMDNPELTTRTWPGKNPIRIIIDKNLSLSNTANVFDGAVKTYIFNKSEMKTEGNLNFVSLDWNLYPVQFLLYQLYLLEINSVIIEGGAKTINWFLDSEIWDEARIITSTMYLKNGLKSPKINGILKQAIKLKSDTIRIYNHY